MKLDVNALRYLSKDDFRVLTAVEMGQKNHEIVPMPLIDSISGLKHGGAYRCIRNLLKHKLVHHENQKYEGYRLTYMGYDFLAIRALTARGHISGVGRQIGVGKESDIYEVMNDDGEVFALKLHRLGRTSFRAVKNQRDYLGRRTNYSWLYLSRLAALKEFAFMKALGEHGFPVPQAIDSNRHAVLMTMVDGAPLVQKKQLRHPAQVYLTCMELISRLAGKGLIHCDFNEFNLLISEDEELTIIDFPQMVSVSHANAEELFQRDVECIIRFFSKKVGYIPENDPALPYVRPNFQESIADVDEDALDVTLAASGFQKQHQAALDGWLATAGDHQETGSDEDEDEEGEDADTLEEEKGEGEGEEEDQDEDVNNIHGAHPHIQSLAIGDDSTSDKQHDTAHNQGLGTVGEDLQGSNSEQDEHEDEDEDELGNDEQQWSRPAASISGRSKAVSTRTHSALGAREVQAAVNAQRKKQQKMEMVSRATRNMSKQAKGKGTRKQEAGGGGGADFGGW